MKKYRPLYFWTLLTLGFLLPGATVMANPPVFQSNKNTAIAFFAGGCFWCIEADFEKLPGILNVDSGYMGGTVVNPTYEQVSSGKTGHIESVRVQYDPQRISYSQLLEFFWKNIDPTVKNQQFCDVGPHYRSAIFYQNAQEEALAKKSKLTIAESGQFTEIHTEVIAASIFYLAEKYHQDYYKKNPIRYEFYRSRCGRDARLKVVWGKPKKAINSD